MSTADRGDRSAAPQDPALEAAVRALLPDELVSGDDKGPE